MDLENNKFSEKKKSKSNSENNWNNKFQKFIISSFSTFQCTTFKYHTCD